MTRTTIQRPETAMTVHSTVPSWQAGQAERAAIHLSATLTVNPWSDTQDWQTVSWQFRFSDPHSTDKNDLSMSSPPAKPNTVAASVPAATMDNSPRVSCEYINATTPHSKPMSTTMNEEASAAAFEPFAVNNILYSSVGLVLLLVLQFGWSISQLNLSTFNSEDDCDARPVVDGTCLMFPGHSTGQWSLAVNAWIVGGMIGSLGSGRVADFFGRKRSLMGNALVLIAGSLIQASAPSVGILALGRFVSGVASGTSTSIPNSFINEISPPHLRNRLGVSYQTAVGMGILLLGISFFIGDTSSGWRYIAGFPIVLAVVFLLGAPLFMVESPTWLLTQGRREEAEIEITRLYGKQNVQRALAWMAVHTPEDEAEQGAVKAVARPSASGHDTEDADSETSLENPYKALFSKEYRMQTIIAIVLSLAQQLSGINAVFFYSSSLFQDAGLSDDRIGTIIVDIVNLLPTFAAGFLGTKFGTRRMLLLGHFWMLLSAVGITISLLANISWLSILFTATYVAAFAVSLGPLVFVVATSIFPNSLRATGTSLCLFANWVGTLIVGIGYPHVANALGDWGFVPFWASLSFFGLFLFKYLPETSGKTGEEIQELFRTKNRKQRALV